MGHEGHDHPHSHGSAPSPVATFLVTCSDSRTRETDTGGALARRLIESAGHLIVGHVLVKEEPSDLLSALEGAIAAGARAVVFTGGTGFSSRDRTAEVIAPKHEKIIPGFGELFRALSFQQIGSAAMLSRATAGLYRGASVFLLPGSPDAIELALQRLILPELGHLLRELLR
jgi:molybdenum cofactor biosynthesis protein B